MKKAWRWYGPDDPVSLESVRQAGASDVVTALHHVPIGGEWTKGEVAKRKQQVEAPVQGRVPLKWSVVESIPVTDSVKRLGKEAKTDIDSWIASMEAVAANDINIICYNFMPVVDWTRTDLDFVTPTGSTAMRFDQDRFAAFDLHILRRKDAEKEYTTDERQAARKSFDAMDEEEIKALTSNITSALPGSTSESLSVSGFREKLETYREVDADTLRQNLVDFLEAVTPRAEELGIRLTLHPDDPPRPLFGLPRIASTKKDYDALFTAIPSPANGMCFCTGSLGVRADNDLVAIARKFADRIHFAHLRATRREADGKSFYEAAHLEGDVDMVAVLKCLLEAERSENGRSIIFRPDHGQRMLCDLSMPGNPGYPAVGRLRGLAELRGILAALGEVA